MQGPLLPAHHLDVHDDDHDPGGDHHHMARHHFDDCYYDHTAYIIDGAVVYLDDEPCNDRACDRPHVHVFTDVDRLALDLADVALQRRLGHIPHHDHYVAAIRAVLDGDGPGPAAAEHGG